MPVTEIQTVSAWRGRVQPRVHVAGDGPPLVFLHGATGLAWNPFLDALAGVTERIGLIATASTTYEEPYNLARRFASLDAISNGRAGWNVVTTAALDAGANFGYTENPTHAERYDRADEFVEVVLGLWDGWDDDAEVADKASGVHTDPAKIHAIEHHGRHFSVRGPLTVGRSEQGRPVIVQAGSSGPGIALAAAYAEAVFTAQRTLEDGQKFYRELKQAFGIDPCLERSLADELAPVLRG